MRLVHVLSACVAALVGCGGGNDSQPPPQTPPPQQPPPYYGNYNPNAPPPGAMGPGPSGPMTSAPPPTMGSPTTGAPPPTMGSPTPTTGAPPATGTPAPGGFQIPGLPPFPGATGAPPAGQSSGPSAQPIDPNLAGPATAILNFVAASDAPGMQKEGAPLAGNFQEGQVLEQPVTIQPGKCYAIVAAGVGPQELEISLVPQSAIPGLPSVGSLGSAKGSAQKTVLGGGGNCIRLALIPVPVNAKFILKASRGAGLAAGQVFVK